MEKHVYSILANIKERKKTNPIPNRGVAAINKVRGQICPFAVAIGSIACVNMHAFMKSWGALPPVQ